MNTESIQKFLMPPEEGGAYTDEKLAALLAHAQDGKLAHNSCCCLAGIPSATHALRGTEQINWPEHGGDIYAFGLGKISLDFNALGRREANGDAVMDEVRADELRRERLIPLILAEMERREQKRTIREEIQEAEIAGKF